MAAHARSRPVPFGRPPPLPPPLLQLPGHLQRPGVAPAAVVVADALLLVAARAGQRQVLAVIRSTPGARDDVLDACASERLALQAHGQPGAAVQALADPQLVLAHLHAFERGVAGDDGKHSQSLGFAHLTPPTSSWGPLRWTPSGAL